MKVQFVNHTAMSKGTHNPETIISPSLTIYSPSHKLFQGYKCQMEMMEAARTLNSWDIKSRSKFVGAWLSHLLREPICVYQLAIQLVCKVAPLFALQLIVTHFWIISITSFGGPLTYIETLQKL